MFYPEYQNTIFSEIVSAKNTPEKKLDFWTNTVDYPLKKWRFFGSLKTSFFWFKTILFYPEYQKTDLFCLFLQKHTNEKRCTLWNKENNNHGLTPLNKADFCHLLKRQFSGLKTMRFYPECQNATFSDIISAKNTPEKKLNFWTKTVDYLLTKMSIFWLF